MTELFSVLAAHQKENTKEELPVEKSARVMADFFAYTALGVVIAWSIRPILSLRMILPFPYGFPFSLESILPFVSAYTLVVVLLCFIGSGNFAVDTSFVVLASHLCVRIRALCDSWLTLDLATPFVDSAPRVQTMIKRFVKEQVEIVR